MRRGVLNPIKPLWQLIHRRYAVRENVHIGRSVHIGLGSILWAPRRLTVGDDVYVGKGCTIEVDGTIGSHVLIANRVGIVGKRDHDYLEVGTPITQATWVGDDPRLSDEVQIGNDVWLGYGSVVLSGITIGEGSIVAAGSVVTRDVRPYAIVAGNPAREVGLRFADADARRHRKILASQ